MILTAFHNSTKQKTEIYTVTYIWSCIIDGCRMYILSISTIIMNCFEVNADVIYCTILNCIKASQLLRNRCRRSSTKTNKKKYIKSCDWAIFFLTLLNTFRCLQELLKRIDSRCSPLLLPINEYIAYIYNMCICIAYQMLNKLNQLIAMGTSLAVSRKLCTVTSCSNIYIWELENLAVCVLPDARCTINTHATAEAFKL